MSIKLSCNCDVQEVQLNHRLPRFLVEMLTTREATVLSIVGDRKWVERKVTPELANNVIFELCVSKHEYAYLALRQHWQRTFCSLEH